MLPKFAIGLLCFFLIATGGAGTAGAEQATVITGLLTDDFQIVADDGSIYTVEISKPSSELFEFTDHRVRATGVLKMTENGPLFIVNDLVIVE